MIDGKQNSPENQLEVYLVGGAVRDRLMGLEAKDRDWVVVGSTPQQMLQLGFISVGKDFPVFLHPQTKEEYALARMERKLGKGYHDFEFDYNPAVTLQQDLMRRDLTINAIAMDDQGNLIDPCDGKLDIEHRLLRHVGNAFSEDPVRVLRVARFAARFQQFGFTVVSSTCQMMRQMVNQGEVNALAAERVWRELFLCMHQGRLSVFITVLQQCDALRVILPEIDALFGVPQTKKYHPEVDTGIHLLLSLDAAQKLSDDPKIIFAVLLHDLGKGITEKSQLPSHKRHEKAGLPLVKQLCDRLAVPKNFRQFALRVCQWHLHCHRINQLKPETVLRLFNGLDAFRDTEVVEKFALCCMADTQGRTGYENDDYAQQRQLLQSYYKVALDIDVDTIIDKYKQQSIADSGEKIRAEIEQARIKNIASIKNQLFL